MKLARLSGLSHRRFFVRTSAYRFQIRRQAQPVALRNPWAAGAGNGLEDRPLVVLHHLQ